MQTVNAVETYRNVVYPWQCDHMGHMNAQFYAAVFDAACFGILNHVARMPDLSEKGLGWADIRQVIEYRHEIRSGTMMLVRSWVVEVGRSPSCTISSRTAATRSSPRPRPRPSSST